MRLLTLVTVSALFAAPLAAEEAAEFDFGGDAFRAGRSVTLSVPSAGDFFGAGENVTLSGELGGSAHMAGRAVMLEAPVAGNFYGAGMDVDLRGPVSGNVTMMGYDLTVTERVSGNLRASGKSVEIAAPIAGSAILGGETVEIGGVISGDLALAAKFIDWDGGAKVLGKIDIYTDAPETLMVPDFVAGPDQVTIHDVKEWETDHGQAFDAHKEKEPFSAKIGSFFAGVVVVGLLATLFAGIAPAWVAGLRREALHDPLRTAWVGFLGLSALIGSVVVLALTGIGIIVAPFTILSAILLALVGYVVGAYATGVFALSMAGRDMPATMAERAMAAFAGAFLLALIGAAPFLGWFVVLAVTLVGAGALLVKWFSPTFFGDEI